MSVNENQAIEIAKTLLKEEIEQSLPLIGAIYVPEAKAGGAEGYYNDQPARWLVSFQCDVPEGIYPDHIDVMVDPTTGEAYAPRMY